MKPDDIHEIRVDVESNGEKAVSMMLNRDGTIGRQGSGAVPMNDPAVLGMTDGRYFQRAMEMVDERVFPHAGVYDYPEKHGVPVSYTLVFLGEPPQAGNDRAAVGFQISIGTENPDVHAIVKYVDTFVSNTVASTQPYYDAALAGKRGNELPGGM